jgi:hypothetical protein
MFKNVTRLIYFCSLNYKNEHFTLLEINKQEEVIRYYDLITDKDVINDIRKLIRINRLMKMRCFFNDEGGDAFNPIVEGV